MTKADVIKIIVEESSTDPLIVSQVLEAFFVTVKEALAEGEPITVRGFGRFVLKKKAQKVGRNIAKNEAVIIHEQTIPYFKPAEEFIEKIKQRGNP